MSWLPLRIPLHCKVIHPLLKTPSLAQIVVSSMS